MKKTLFVITLILLVNYSFGQFKILSNYTAEMSNGALTFKTSQNDYRSLLPQRINV